MMRRSRFLVAAFLALFALSGLQAQTKLPWFTSGIKAFLESGGPMVLGWSKAGTVALLADVDTGGRGGSAVRFVLVDAVEDEVLVDSNVWSDEVEADEQDNAAMAVAMAASNPAQEFLQNCLDANLIPVEASARDLKAFPLVYQGSSITARAVITSKSDESDEDVWGGRAIDYRVVVTSSTRGQKTVSSAKLGHAFEVNTIGYFLSPWESRALIASWYSQPGFEGEQPRTYVFSGCHLTLGFKK